MLDIARLFPVFAALAIVATSATPVELSHTASAAGGHAALSPSGCRSGWSVDRVPNKGGSMLLFSLAAESPSDIWAVGVQSGENSVVMHNDGTTWSNVPLPQIGDGWNELVAVAAASTSSAWAAGQYAGSPGGMFIINWDGSQRSLAPSLPNVNSGLLYAMAASAPNNAWAVGYYLDPNTHYMSTLILHWDGNSWSQTPSPNPALNPAGGHKQSGAPSWIGAKLTAVTATGPDNAWAVGEALPTGAQQTLIEHWDGTQWSIVPSPNAEGSNHLRGVAASQDGQVWAMGDHQVGNTNYLLALHWDGASWGIVSAPPVRLTSNYSDWPMGVSAADSNNVWSAGMGEGSPARPLIMRWNGSGWDMLALGSLSSNMPELLSVAALSNGEVWALGTDSNDSSTMRFSPGCSGARPAK